MGIWDSLSGGNWTQGAEGFLGAVPLGFLAGAYGGSGNPQQDAANQKLQQYYQSLLGRQAPQMGAAAQGQYSDFRQNQSNLINHLEALSNGQGPSLAMAQLQAATDKNQSSQQAFAASGRGGPLASAQAANNMMRTGSQASQDAVGARIQEEQMALGMLGSNINAGRSSDESTNQFNASQQNEQARANLEARLRTMGMNDQAIQQVLSQMFGASQLPQLGDKILSGATSLAGLAGGMGRGQGGGFGFGSTGPSGFNAPPSYGWQNASGPGSPFSPPGDYYNNLGNGIA